MIPEDIKKIINTTARELRNIYTDRLRELILFGSYARGDYSTHSDIDIAAIIDNVSDAMVEHEKYFDVISHLSLENDVVLSVVPIDSRDFEQKRSPLILNIEKEGIRV